MALSFSSVGKPGTYGLGFGPGTKLVTYPPPAPQVPYGAEALALFARMAVQPDTARKNIINALILRLQMAGLWTKLKFLYVHAAHNQQAALLNWRENAHNLTVSGTVTHTTDQGAAGNGVAGSCLLSTYNPTTHGGMAMDDCHFGFLAATTDAAVAYDMGFQNNGYRVRLRSSGTIITNISSTFHSWTPAVAVVAAPNSHILSRRSANDAEYYRDGASASTDVTSTSPVAQPSTSLVLLSDTPTGNSCTRRQIAAHGGSGLTDAEAASMSEHLRWYAGQLGISGF